MTMVHEDTMTAGSRSLEDVVTDLQALTHELIAVAGPATLDGLSVGGGPGVGVRLTAVSPLLRTVATQLDVLRMTWLRRIEADGTWALDGSRAFRTWLARRERVTMRTASRDVLTGERLAEHLPATLAAALGGRLGMDQVRAMVDVGPTSEDRRRALVTPVEAPVPDGTPGAGAPDGTVQAGAGGADGGSGTDRLDGDRGGNGGDRNGDNGGGCEGGGCDGGGCKGGGDRNDGDGDGGTRGNGDGTGNSDGRRPDRGSVPAPTGEELLLDLAGQHGPLAFRRLVDRFARVADPESDERGYRQATEREHLDVAKTFGGYHVAGFLTDEHGEALRVAMDSVMGSPTPGDDRTPTQRRAQALADLARTALDSGRTGSRAAVRPHVTVTVSWSELERLTARLGSARNGGSTTRADHDGARTGHEGVDPATTGTTRLTDVTAAPARFGISASLVPEATLRRLLCDSAVTRVVFGPDSQVLDVGRSHRTVTGQMRRAVMARDKHCVFADCTQPPARCEVHHAERHWADGGETSVRNAALLCWHHHDLVDTTGITMRWTGNPGGTRHSGWTLADRHGREIRSAGTSMEATESWDTHPRLPS